MKKIMGIMTIIILILAGRVSALALTEGDYEYSVKNDVATITKVSETLSGEVVIPETIGGYVVEEIGNFAFSETENIVKVFVPDTVKVLGAYAFYCCYGLQEIVLPEGLEEIGHYAFTRTKLNEIDIPQSVKSIGMFAFSSTNIETITLGENVSDIMEGAFCMTKLKSITICEENENYASFGGVLFTKDLKTLVTFPAGRSGSYNVPEGVESIYGSAFESSCIDSLSLPKSLVRVGDQSFVGCKMEALYIESIVKNIVYGNLDYCKSLKNIYFSGSEEDWKRIGLTSYNLPKGVVVNYNASATDKAEVYFSLEGAEVKVDSALCENKVVICTMYKDGALVSIVSAIANDEMAPFKLVNDFDKVKILVLDSMETLMPVYEVEMW